jgi:ubiquinone/menaquinone biosynthesis C-methylase UbiE
VGGGRGWPGLYLAQRSGCQVALADVPKPGLADALRRADELGLAGRALIVRAAGERLPFPPQSFDAVVHTDTL